MLPSSSPLPDLVIVYIAGCGAQDAMHITTYDGRFTVARSIWFVRFAVRPCGNIMYFHQMIMNWVGCRWSSAIKTGWTIYGMDSGLEFVFKVFELPNNKQTKTHRGQHRKTMAMDSQLFDIHPPTNVMLFSFGHGQAIHIHNHHELKQSIESKHQNKTLKEPSNSLQIQVQIIEDRAIVSVFSA